MVEQADLAVFAIPADAKTVIRDIERDDMENFKLALSSKKQLTHDTWELEYTFGEGREDWYLGMKTGGHLLFEATIDGKIVSRKYTPVSSIHQKGKVVFVIKAYAPTEKFPAGGIMSQWICAKPVGYMQDFCEGNARFDYLGNAMFSVNQQARKITKLGLICMGTGIAPIFSVLQSIKEAKDTSIQVQVLYSNRTEGDMLLGTDLNAIVKDCPNI